MAFAPRQNEWRVEAIVAGQAVGLHQLLASDPAGQCVVDDFKTGQTPDDAFRLQFDAVPLLRAVYGRTIAYGPVPVYLYVVADCATMR